ncbi:MAG: hypothetical protein ACYTKD_29015 [Planctomycetota bacterium]|jgi:hypothetical protein
MSAETALDLEDIRGLEDDEVVAIRKLIGILRVHDGYARKRQACRPIRWLITQEFVDVRPLLPVDDQQIQTGRLITDHPGPGGGPVEDVPHLGDVAFRRSGRDELDALLPEIKE